MVSGVGEWDLKAKQWHQDAVAHRKEHGGPMPPRRSAKSIEGKWYKAERDKAPPSAGVASGKPSKPDAARSAVRQRAAILTTVWFPRIFG